MSTLSLFNVPNTGAARAAGGSAAAPATLSETEIAGAVAAGGDEGAGATVGAASAAPAPEAPTSVGIYYITLGISTYRWLCKQHVAERKANGWACKRSGNVEFECDDCLKERNERDGR